MTFLVDPAIDNYLQLADKKKNRKSYIDVGSILFQCMVYYSHLGFHAGPPSVLASWLPRTDLFTNTILVCHTKFKN